MRKAPEMGRAVTRWAVPTLLNLFESPNALLSRRDM